MSCLERTPYSILGFQWNKGQEEVKESYLERTLNETQILNTLLSPVEGHTGLTVTNLGI